MMSTFQAQNISLAFGDRVLLDNVGFTLSSGKRVALAGANGSGKSTLMKIVCGLMAADSCTITATKGTAISYLPQSDIVFVEKTVREQLETAFARFESIQREIEYLTASLKGDESDFQLISRIHELREKTEFSPLMRKEMLINQVVAGLGFRLSDLDRQCSEFSGGWQMRIALAKVLLEDPDFMFLDEPTNYLDLEARLWLESYLKTYKGGLMVVSHDRNFLDECVSSVYELFFGKLKHYTGNYTIYEQRRIEEVKELEKKAREQEREIEKTEAFIERFRYKARKSTQVQSRIKMLEKMEIIELPAHLKKLHFSFPEPPHSGNDVITVENLNKFYGDNHALRDMSFTVRKGERFAVTGRNGEGKSTLLRILAQQDSDFTGTLKIGAGVKTGYFAQDNELHLNPANSVIEELETVATTADQPRLRSLLGSFLFNGDDIFKSVSVLSGGERSRLSLLKILIHPANLLILDEPTNHLDINAKDMLLEALNAYKGTLIFVSHDSWFLEHVASRILYLSNGKYELFEGDSNYFRWKLEHKETEAKPAEPSSFSVSVPEPTESALSYKEAKEQRNRESALRKKSSALLEKVEKLAEEIERLKEDLSLPANYTDSAKAKAISLEIDRKESEREAAEEEWLTLEEELNG